MDTATKNLLNSKYCNAVGFLTRLILIRLDGIGISPTPSKNGEAWSLPDPFRLPVYNLDTESMLLFSLAIGTLCMFRLIG
nr:hypothetical protein HAGR004_14440 [Bdellovibrio sp. HAGR004]